MRGKNLFFLSKCNHVKELCDPAGERRCVAGSSQNAEHWDASWIGREATGVRRGAEWAVGDRLTGGRPWQDAE